MIAFASANAASKSCSRPGMTSRAACSRIMHGSLSPGTRRGRPHSRERGSRRRSGAPCRRRTTGRRRDGSVRVADDAIEVDDLVERAGRPDPVVDLLSCDLALAGEPGRRDRRARDTRRRRRARRSMIVAVPVDRRGSRRRCRRPTCEMSLMPSNTNDIGHARLRERVAVDPRSAATARCRLPTARRGCRRCRR